MNYDPEAFKNYPLLSSPTNLTSQEWSDDLLPMVSITCNTYMHENFIRDAIESFLMQKTTFKVEILVHDDASTDNTADIVREYESKYPHLFRNVYQIENQYKKIPKTKKFIPRYKERGKYIARCEGDDYWTDPYKLQKQVDFLEHNPDYVLCFHDAIVVDENNCQISESLLSYNLYDNTEYDKGRNRHKKDLSSLEMKLAPRVPFLTRCFRNVIKKCPKELAGVVHGDKISTALLGMHGKGKYMGSSVKHAGYRVHSGGVWSTKNVEEQKKNIFDALIRLYYYFFSLKEMETASALLYKRVVPHLYNFLPTEKSYFNVIKGIDHLDIMYKYQMGQARKFFSKKYYNKSLSLLSEMILAFPDDVELLNEIGVVLCKVSRKDDAISYFTKAYSIDPENKRTIDNIETFYGIQVPVSNNKLSDGSVFNSTHLNI